MCFQEKQHNVLYRLNLPNISHVTGCWWVSVPNGVICTNILKKILNFLIVHFFEGVSNFFLCSNKIGPIFTSQSPDFPSSSYKLLQSLYGRICIHAACTFNIYCPTSQTCEECFTCLKFLIYPLLSKIGQTYLRYN